jgi:transposase-like protein
MFNLQILSRWHLDEMVVKVRGRQMYLWRAVDDEGEALDMIMQHRRDAAAALKALRRLIGAEAFYVDHLLTSI